MIEHGAGPGKSRTLPWVPVMASPDVAQSCEFLAHASRWDKEIEPDEPYRTFLRHGGRRVAGTIPVVATQHKRAAWVPAFSVDDPAHEYERAVALGGKPLFLFNDQAFLYGPRGEIFSVVSRELSAHFDPPSARLELVTNDVEVSAQFYTELFDWRVRREADVSGEWLSLSNTTSAIATLSRMDDDWDDSTYLRAIGRISGRERRIYPHWMIYFTVTDCERFIDHVEILGATAVRRPDVVVGIGNSALLTDPAGVYFSVREQDR